MPTLTAPPPPPIATARSLPISPRPPPRLELPTVSFFGRTLAEYERFFALDVPALRGRDVLDVAGGPASFTAEACARKIDAVAVDPLYGAPDDVLTAKVAADYAAIFAQIRARRSLFRCGNGTGFASLAEAEAERRLAAERFLADYAAQRLYGRYVCGSLPRLPFFDGTFDLVLCAHLLFTYAEQFNYDWHLAACRELVRVSAGEVRLHPICGADGRPYARRAALRRDLRVAGIASEVRTVEYEFFAGSNSMLVLNRTT
jgi:SAM-dependent methyltransferase